MASKIELTEPEVRLLQQLLQGDLSRLLLEIAHTDHRAMRDELKKREDLLKGVMDRLAC